MLFLSSIREEDAQTARLDHSLDYITVDLMGKARGLNLYQRNGESRTVA